MAACIGVIYDTLPVGLAASKILRRGGFLTLTLLGGTLALVLLLIVRSLTLPPGYRRLRLRTAALLGLVCFAGLPFVDTLEEWIHFPEYLAVGVLLHGALRCDWRARPLALALIGTAAIALAGWGDELIQSGLPDRFFAWKDVALNLAGGGVPLLILTYLDRPPPGPAES
ncbi:MAG: VanZ family protein [bacterium]